MYPAIPPKRMNGNEVLYSPSGEPVGRLIDFWQWAYSDLVGNAERGALAEYIVACALGIQAQVRTAWDKYDLLTQDGIAVEIKTSGYLQTWDQKELSKLIFGIQPTYGWDSVSNTYDSHKKRQSDIYVFCVHKHTDQNTVNPLRIEQWDFYLMPTHLLNKQFGNAKTATLSALCKAGAVLCPYNELKQQITCLFKG